MNDRAIELYKDALRFAYDNTASTDPKHIVDSLAVGKFAELLIRECMREVIWVGRMNPITDEPMQVANEINQRIKKHFGVE